MSKSNKTTPKQSRIYKNKAKRTPVNRTAAMVVTGTDGLAPGRGNVRCAKCGEAVKESRMKQHLREKHGRRNPVVTEGSRSGNKKRYDAGFVHGDPRAEPAPSPPLGLCICSWCNQVMPIREINRHTRRRPPGKRKRVEMTSADPRWNDR